MFYGAAEFSRDCDIVIIADEQNLSRLMSALTELDAVCIAVPPLDWSHLDRGHAIHFGCKHTDAAGVRLDAMTKMRGCGCFDALWKERTTIEDAEGLIRVAGEYPDLLKQMIKERPLMKELEAM